MEEREKLSRALVESLGLLERAEEEKATSSAQWALEIKTHKAAYKSFARELARGCVTRSARCPVMFHQPKQGYKQILHPETSAVLETKTMDTFETQENLFPEEDETPKPKVSDTKAKPDPATEEKSAVAEPVGKVN